MWSRGSTFKVQGHWSEEDAGEPWMKLMLPLAAILTGITAAAFPAAAPAPGYPTKPIRMIVPSAPAGVADLVARAIGHKLTDAWGQQVVVDNRGGAGGNIGMEVAARSAPDGYTLALGNLGPPG